MPLRRSERNNPQHTSDKQPQSLDEEPARDTSITWDCEDGDMPEDYALHGEEAGQEDAGTSESSEQDDAAGDDNDNSEHEDGNPVDEQQARNARSPNWQPWQDRYLIKMVDKLRPFEAGRRETTNAWEELSSALLKESTEANAKSPIDRTGTACRARFYLLVKFHEVSYSFFLQVPYAHSI